MRSASTSASTTCTTSARWSPPAPSAGGLGPGRVSDLVAAASELAANSILHGGGRGLATVWDDGASVFVEVADAGTIVDPTVGLVRPDPAAESGRGLYIANQLCDEVSIDSSADRDPDPPADGDRDRLVGLRARPPGAAPAARCRRAVRRGCGRSRRRAGAPSSPPAPAAPGIRPAAPAPAGRGARMAGPPRASRRCRGEACRRAAKGASWRCTLASWRAPSTVPPPSRRAPPLAHVDRGRMPGARRRQRPAAVAPAQPHQHRGGEVVQPGALEQQLVDPREHLLRLVDLAGQPAHRVAHGDRDPGRLGALAGDVADQHPAAVLGRQHVVEVAADLDPAPGRLEDDRGLEPLDPGRPRRPQPALQVAGDRVALLVETGVVERQRGPVAELGEELEVLRLVADVGLRVEEGERADLPPARDEPDDRRRFVAGVVDEFLVLLGQREGPRPPRADRGRGRSSARRRAAPGRSGGCPRGRAAIRGGAVPGSRRRRGSPPRRPSRRSGRRRG